MWLVAVVAFIALGAYFRWRWFKYQYTLSFNLKGDISAESGWFQFTYDVVKNECQLCTRREGDDDEDPWRAGFCPWCTGNVGAGVKAPHGH